MTDAKLLDLASMKTLPDDGGAWDAPNPNQFFVDRSVFERLLAKNPDCATFSIVLDNGIISGYPVCVVELACFSALFTKIG